MEIRYLDDLKKVIFDQNWLKTAKNFPVYYMRRGIKKKDGLRYDITEIAGKMLGREFPKTKGHRHPEEEFYKILSGEAIFLFQKCQNKIVKEVFAVKAKKNDAMIIPPNYDHLIINFSKKRLKTGNWISQDCKNNYKFIEKMAGACYYYTKSGWVKNKNYKKIPKLCLK